MNKILFNRFKNYKEINPYKRRLKPKKGNLKPKKARLHNIINKILIICTYKIA